MKEYLLTFIEEKGLSLDHTFEVAGPENSLYGTNYIPLASIVEFIDQLNKDIQNKIKSTIVKIDFHNGDVMDYFKFLAKGMAI